MILMCKYSNEMMTSIKAIKFKYLTIGLECGEGNVLIAFHFYKCELKEKVNKDMMIECLSSKIIK